MMMYKSDPLKIPLLSISRPAWEAFAFLPIESKIIGVFQHAIDILVGDEIIGMITPPYKNGVFHILVSRLPNFSTLGYDIHKPFTIFRDDHGIRIGHWLIEIPPDLPLWEPQPNWIALRDSTQAGFTKKVDSLIHWLSQQTQISPSCYSRVVFGEVVEELALLKDSVLETKLDALKLAVSTIVGKGQGLTPSGDDFLAGLMLGLHLFEACHITREALCETILDACCDKTTRLSVAFLKAASQGLADERWQCFMEALCQEDETILKRACIEVISFGASSGWDMLNGFLWIWEVAYRGKMQCRNALQTINAFQIEGVLCYENN